MFYIPIYPSNDLDTLYTAVRHLVPEPKPLTSSALFDAVTFTSTDVVITSTVVSATAMASLGFKSLVIGGSAKAAYFILDIAATQMAAQPLQGIGYGVYGVGARVAFASASVSGNAAFSLGGLVANTALKGATTKYGATLIGGGALNNIPFFTSAIGATFSADSLQLLGNGINELFAIMANPNNSSGFIPSIIGVVPESQAPQQSYAVSYEYGLRAVNKGWNYTQAQENIPTDVPASLNLLNPPGFALDTSIVAGVYQSLGVGLSANPSSQQKQTAGDLYNCGP